MRASPERTAPSLAHAGTEGNWESREPLSAPTSGVCHGARGRGLGSASQHTFPGFQNSKPTPSVKGDLGLESRGGRQLSTETASRGRQPRGVRVSPRNEAASVVHD